MPCIGILVQWTPGLVWDTYPYQLHSVSSVDWEPIGFIKDAQQLRLHADACLDETDSVDLTCIHCSALLYTTKFWNFVDHAHDALEHTNWKYLNSQQLVILLEKYSDNCIKLHTQITS